MFCGLCWLVPMIRYESLWAVGVHVALMWKQTLFTPNEICIPIYWQYYSPNKIDTVCNRLKFESLSFLYADFVYVCDVFSPSGLAVDRCCAQQISKWLMSSHTVSLPFIIFIYLQVFRWTASAVASRRRLDLFDWSEDLTRSRSIRRCLKKIIIILLKLVVVALDKKKPYHI